MNNLPDGPRVRFLQRLQFYLPPFDLPIGSYMIAGSGPLAIRNLREALDIDIIAIEALWQVIQKQHPGGGKCVEVGRLDFAIAHAPHRIEPMIVGEQEDDIRLRPRCAGGVCFAKAR